MVSARELSPEERRRLIAEAAYHRAERRGFRGGDPVLDWLDAEAEIDAMFRPGIKDRALAKLKSQVQIANLKLNELKPKIAALKREAGSEIREEIENLDELKQQLDRKLAEIKVKTGHAKQKAKREAEALWDELAALMHRIGPR